MAAESEPSATRLETPHPSPGPANDKDFLRQVGDRARLLRRQRGLTLEQVAERSGMSVGALSQLERGMGNPSLGTVGRVAHTLGIPVPSLLSSAPERSPVVRRGDRRPVSMHPEPGSGDVEGRFELMTPGPNHQLEVLWVEVPAGVSTEMTPYSHGGEEVGVVLEGVHEVHIGGVVHVLEAGDSITYASDIPHWYRNPGPATVRAIWIITPPTW